MRDQRQRGENARDDFRQAKLLGHLQGGALIAGPDKPALAADRPFGPQKGFDSRLRHQS